MQNENDEEEENLGDYDDDFDPDNTMLTEQQRNEMVRQHRIEQRQRQLGRGQPRQQGDFDNPADRARLQQRLDQFRNEVNDYNQLVQIAGVEHNLPLLPEIPMVVINPPNADGTVRIVPVPPPPPPPMPPNNVQPRGRGRGGGAAANAGQNGAGNPQIGRAHV